MPLGRALWFGVFHSISAFCNAGFDLQGGFVSYIPYRSSVGVNLVVMALIQAGALSYVVFSDIGATRRWRSLALDTKLVLIVHGLVLAAAAGVFLLLEWNASLAGASPGTKVLASLFQSVSARSGGVASIDFAAAHAGTLFVWVLVMAIGGAAGSTAGGVKLATIGVVFVAVLSTLRGADEPRAFGRSLSTPLVMRSFVVIFVFFAVHFLATVALVATGTFLREYRPHLCRDHVRDDERGGDCRTLDRDHSATLGRRQDRALPDDVLRTARTADDGLCSPAPSAPGPLPFPDRSGADRLMTAVMPQPASRRRKSGFEGGIVVRLPAFRHVRAARLGEPPEKGRNASDNAAMERFRSRRMELDRDRRSGAPVQVYGDNWVVIGLMLDRGVRHGHDAADPELDRRPRQAEPDQSRPLRERRAGRHPGASRATPRASTSWRCSSSSSTSRRSSSIPGPSSSTSSGSTASSRCSSSSRLLFVGYIYAWKKGALEWV